MDHTKTPWQKNNYKLHWVAAMHVLCMQWMYIHSNTQILTVCVQLIHCRHQFALCLQLSYTVVPLDFCQRCPVGAQRTENQIQCDCHREFYSSYSEVHKQ